MHWFRMAGGDSSTIAALERVGALIVRGKSYGEMYWSPSLHSVWYVNADWYNEEDGWMPGNLIHKILEQVPGVHKAIVESEAHPPEDEDWKQIKPAHPKFEGKPDEEIEEIRTIAKQAGWNGKYRDEDHGDSYLWEVVGGALTELGSLKEKVAQALVNLRSDPRFYSKQYLVLAKQVAGL